MAYTNNQNPAGLDVLTSLDSGDLVVVGDVSDSNRVKAITRANLMALKADLASPTFTGTPSLPTGTTAVTQSASNNSTKVATTAYVDTQTALGGTSCKTIFPQYNGAPINPSITNAFVGVSMADNTRMYLAQVVIPFAITVNKITTKNNIVAVGGTIDLTLYSEDGQTQIFSVTSPTITNGLTVVSTVSSVSVPAGVYYLGVNTNSTASVTMWFYSSNKSDGDTTGDKNLNVLASEPTMGGYITITASTPPATITPGSITVNDENLIFSRLDN